jgi:hypothetical protein
VESSIAENILVATAILAPNVGIVAKQGYRGPELGPEFFSILT